MFRFEMGKWQVTVMFIFGFVFTFLYSWLTLAWKGVYNGPVALDMMAPVIIGVCFAYVTRAIRGSGWILAGAMAGAIANKAYFVDASFRPIEVYNIVIVAGMMIGFWAQREVTGEKKWSDILLVFFLANLWGFLFWFSQLMPHLATGESNLSGLISGSWWPLVAGLSVTLANKGDKNLTLLYAAFFLLMQAAIATLRLGWSSLIWQASLMQAIPFAIAWYVQKRFNFLSLG